jgi:hypothetical protein
MRRYTCDTCGNDIDTDGWWAGVDVFLPPTDDEEQADLENDYEYGRHFDSWGCMGAYSWNQERAEAITD